MKNVIDSKILTTGYLLALALLIKMLITKKSVYYVETKII